jgi:predicted amidohydrolase YtcJ
MEGATSGAAYSCFAEHRVGSLEVGKLADFIVVDMDWDGQELLNASIKETWFEGDKVYGA